MSLQAIIRRRQRALYSAWVRSPLVQVQAESPDILPMLVFLDDYGAGASSQQLGRRSYKNVALVQRPGNPDENASVWVRAKYGSYQKAYLDFINRTYDLKATTADLAGYNVDHLLNRARSPEGAGFIRVEAINDQVNQAWGRLVEKAASHPDFYANQERLRRTMSWFIAAKLMDQMPPRGPDDRQGITRLGAFFRQTGLAQDDPMQELHRMLEFAYRFRS